MKRPLKITLQVFAYVLLALIISAGLLSLWLYKGSLSKNKIAFFKLLPLPIAKVNGDSILASEFIVRYDYSQKFAPNVSKNDILDQIISEKKISILAQKEEVTVGSNQVESQYNESAQSEDLQGKKSFEDLLKTYGVSESAYKSEIIKPRLLLINLQTWFCSQQNLNQDAYSQANALVQKIQKGDNIAILASTYSQQSPSKSTGGDLGYVSVTDLVPEIREAVDSMKINEIKIVPSRFGLNILRLEGKKENLLHLRQIFLRGSNFEAWQERQTKNFSTKILINI
jgi:parvulin-like peptidyl-prolyl isomerase